MSRFLVQRILISVIFLLSGLAKLAGSSFEIDAFQRWGYPAGFMYFIGILEIAGGLGIWVRHLSTFVALCLSGLMLGALGTQLWHADWLMAGITALILVLVGVYTWHLRAHLFPSGDDGEDE